MKHLRLVGPYSMSVDAAIPDRFWPAVRWACTYVLSWALPLVAIERFADSHLDAGMVLTIFTLVDWVVAAKWDLIAQFVADWRPYMAWVFIAFGALSLAIGVYLLGIHDGSTATDNNDQLRRELQIERDSKTALDVQLAATRNELQVIQRKLEDARQAPVPVAPPPPKRQLGPLTTLQIVESLAARHFGSPAAPAPPKSNPSELRWALVVTAPKENEEIANIIAKLITSRLDAFRLDIPDRSNLDAPVFPEPGDAGITLHGTSVLNQRLAQVLAQCFIVRTTSRTIDGLREWYSNRTAPEQDIVWIEIGNGSPWKEPFRCSD